MLSRLQNGCRCESEEEYGMLNILDGIIGGENSYSLSTPSQDRMFGDSRWSSKWKDWMQSERVDAKISEKRSPEYNS